MAGNSIFEVVGILDIPKDDVGIEQMMIVKL
jgi:hypothetical protein